MANNFKDGWVNFNAMGTALRNKLMLERVVITEEVAPVPVIDIIGNFPAMTKDVPITPFSFSAAGGAPPYVFDVAGGTMPVGLTMDQTGLVSGTPTLNGNYSVTIRATDSTALSGSEVRSGRIEADLNILGDFPPMKEGVRIDTFAFTTTGGTGPYTYSVSGGVMPPGLTLSNNGTVFGSPNSSGNYNVTIRSLDSRGSFVNHSYTGNIEAAPVISILGEFPVDMMVGVDITPTQFTANGGTPPYTFVEVGNIIEGLNLNSSGLLTGTPTLAGNYNLVMQASDAEDFQGSRHYTGTVAPALVDIQVIGDYPNDMQVGTEITPFYFTATGGTGPYTFSEYSGASPDGINTTSNGYTSGTPTNAGGFDVVIQAEDSLGNAGYREYNESVAEAPNSFSPADLFINGENGCWFDYSDLDVMFQDQNGVMDTTDSGQFIGLMLDKSKGLEVGPNTVLNGTFDTDYDKWVTQNSTASVTEGVVTVTAINANAAELYQPISAPEPFGLYRITATCKAEARPDGKQVARLRFQEQGGQNRSVYIDTSDEQTLVLYFRNNGSGFNGSLQLQVTGSDGYATVGQKGYFDNVKMELISGNHATQAAANNRPIYFKASDIHYGSFDGISKRLSNYMDLSTDNEVTVVCGLYLSGINGEKGVYEFSRRSSAGSFSHRWNYNSNIHYTRGASAETYCEVANQVEGIQRVTSALFKLDAATPANAIKVRDNGIEIGSGQGPIPGGGNFNYDEFNMGKNGSEYLNGYITQMVVINRILTEQELNDLETYIAQKTGVTL